jgi:hypothetical protein
VAKKYSHLRVSSLWHDRLNAARLKERRTIIEVTEFALKAYLEANHPEILSQIVEDPEATEPVKEIKPPQKKPKKS